MIAVVDGREWDVTWSVQQSPPSGKNHGASAVCLAARKLVLVSPDGIRWELPAGRPEGSEPLRDTMVREVWEEACCEVDAARLLGFTRSTCLEGPQEGLVLVRSHWAARVRVLPWTPRHEITHRRLVQPSSAKATLALDTGLGPVIDPILSTAVAAFTGELSDA